VIKANKSMAFHEELKLTMHLFAKFIYRVTKKFPKDEIFGMTSQLRRAGLSIVLNYIEGYARRKGDRCKVYNNFLEISYGSLKETKYLLYFALDEKYLSKEEYNEGLEFAEKIGKMLWCLLK
jgi:four helix bundle protein